MFIFRIIFIHSYCTIFVRVVEGLCGSLSQGVTFSNLWHRNRYKHNKSNDILSCYYKIMRIIFATM